MVKPASFVDNGMRFACCTCCGRGGIGGPKIEAVRWDRDGKMIDFRCERHMGRNPCVIPGCGRSFAHKDDATYEHIIMCGRHWRQGPKRLRDRDRTIRRLAKKRGWTDRIIDLHHHNWERVRQAVEEGGRLDMTEINQMFGWGE